MPNKEKDEITLVCETCMNRITVEVEKGEKIGCWICSECQNKNCSS